MTESIQSSSECGVTQLSETSQEASQELVSQLLMFTLGCNSAGDGRGASFQEEVLKQKLSRFEASLSPQKAGELQGMLDHLPTETSSETYFSELTVAYTKVMAFIVSNIPNGLSLNQYEALHNLVAQQVEDPSDKNYAFDVATWAAHVAALSALQLTDALSPSAKEELNNLFIDQPNNPEDKVYPLEMIQFLAELQVFFAKNVFSTLSPTDKAKLNEQLKKLQTIDLNDKVAPEEVELASAELELMISKMFF